MASYLYNGVMRPDINEIWTDELKALYPYAVMLNRTTPGISPQTHFFISEKPFELFQYDEYTHGHNLYLSVSPGCLCWISRTGELWQTLPSVPDNMAIVNDDDVMRYSVWCNHTISGYGYEFLPSEPILVTAPTIDPQSLTAGWLVGKKIAGMRGK